MMPRKNELCGELKKSEEYKDIIVVLLTAVADAVTSTSFTHMDGKQPSPNDFIPKPIKRSGIRWEARSGRWHQTERNSFTSPFRPDRKKKI